MSSSFINASLSSVEQCRRISSNSYGVIAVAKAAAMIGTLSCPFFLVKKPAPTATGIELFGCFYLIASDVFYLTVIDIYI
jgi:hypothetical protein